MTINLLEIRNYLIKPDMVDPFIDYFESHFIASQEAVGMRILGQFRVIGEPNHFVWLRGFSDMETRLEGLQSFYSGRVWKQYRSLANDMMLECDNVHLLRPTSQPFDLTRGSSAERVAAEFAAGTISPYLGVVAVDFYEALPGKRDELVNFFETNLNAGNDEDGVQRRGCFVAEMSQNDFPALPVIQNENEVVVIRAYESEADYHEKSARVTPPLHQMSGTLLSATPHSLLLKPTLRSPLRYADR